MKTDCITLDDAVLPLETPDINGEKMIISNENSITINWRINSKFVDFVEIKYRQGKANQLWTTKKVQAQDSRYPIIRLTPRIR